MLPPAGQVCVPLFVAWIVNRRASLTGMIFGTALRSKVADQICAMPMLFDGGECGPVPATLVAVTVKT